MRKKSRIEEVGRKKSRIVVGLSGRGRSLQNLMACQENYGYTIYGVFSSSPYAAGLKYAYDAGIPAMVLNFKDKNIVATMSGWLQQLNIDGIVLAGFTRHFPDIPDFEPRTISIHPSRLPDFGGKGMFGRNVHEAVFAAGCTESGATVHLVTDGYDEGRIISQISVDISSCSTVDAVQDKVFDAECLLYPRTIDFLVQNNWAELPPLQYEAREDGSCIMRADLEDKYDKCG